MTVYLMLFFLLGDFYYIYTIWILFLIFKPKGVSTLNKVKIFYLEQLINAIQFYHTLKKKFFNYKYFIKYDLEKKVGVLNEFNTKPRPVNKKKFLLTGY